MDDKLAGESRLDRQRRHGPSPKPGRQTPQRVPETKPTLLGDWFVYLSIVVLVCGVIVITVLELGQPLASPIVRLPLLVGGAVLLVVGADALVRVWRSAWAWLPVDRGRGLFRFIWVAVLALILVATIGALWLAVSA